MKFHLTWIRRTAAAAIVAGASVSPAAAQYAPYRPIQKAPVAPVQPAAQPAPRVAAQQPYWQQAAAQTAATRYQAPTAASQYPPYPTTSGAYVPAATAVTQPYAPRTSYAPTAPVAASQYPQYPASYPTYPHVAQQPTPEQAPTPTVEEMPAPVGATNGTNGSVNGGSVVEYNGVNGHSHGYANGGNGNYGAGSYYGGAQCSDDYGISDYFDQSCHDTQWFGGAYFLFMERDNASPVKLTARVDHSVAPGNAPYYPLGHTTVLSTHDTDHDYREGVEVRLGSTFTIMSSSDTCDTGCYDGCNSCQPCAADVYAWEVAWWGLDDSPEDLTYVDATPGDLTRIYGMKNFVGLQYDREGDGIYNPGDGVNGYYGYALPIPVPPALVAGYTEVLAQRVRQNFKAQNLELNFIRFPVCDFACGGGGCDTCNTGCESCESCEPCGPTSAFSAYGSCGVRYFRVDDDFMYANDFRTWDGAAWDKPTFDGWSYDQDSELYYDVQVENHLIGPQLGWTMNYCVACKWNFFANSTFGVFNNRIEQVQQMWSGGDGTVRFEQNGETFYVESEKNDISFLGELRVGGSYDITCNWRAVAAYRAVAIAGIANSTDQIPSDFTNYEYVQIIDSDSSIIVHGVQVGAECRY